LYKTKSTPLRDAFYNLWCSVILLPPEGLHGFVWRGSRTDIKCLDGLVWANTDSN